MLLSREVVEGQQRVAILDQALDHLFDLTPHVSPKASSPASAAFLVSAIQISCGARLAEGAIRNCEFGAYRQAASLEVEQEFAPRLRALAHAIDQANQLLLAL